MSILTFKCNNACKFSFVYLDFHRGICLPLWLVPYGAKFCLRYGCVHLPLKSTDAVCIIILEGSWKKLSECKVFCVNIYNVLIK